MMLLQAFEVACQPSSKKMASIKAILYLIVTIERIWINVSYRLLKMFEFFKSLLSKTSSKMASITTIGCSTESIIK